MSDKLKVARIIDKFAKLKLIDNNKVAPRKFAVFNRKDEVIEFKDQRVYLYFDEIVRNFKNLTIIKIDNMKQLNKLPMALRELNNLRELHINNCNIEIIPNWINTLTNLEIINLENNNIIKIPIEFTELKELISLNLNGNQISDIPTEFVNLNKLRNLNLGNNNFDGIPEVLLNLNIQNLNISGNYIHELPYNWKKIQYSLKKFDCIQKIPIEQADGVLKLEKLIELSLNPIIIPFNINHLKNLRKLVITESKNTELPLEISLLKQLIILKILNGRLLRLPENIHLMSELQELHATNNLLTTLPRSIGALRKIKKINVKNNNIIELPTTVDRLKDIILELEGNPILKK